MIELDTLEPQMRRLRTELDRRVPQKQSRDMEVTFLAANTDQDVLHGLIGVEDPETITYQVVRKDRACDVYDNQTSGHRVWTKVYLTLRCTQAGAVVTLRISSR